MGAYTGLSVSGEARRTLSMSGLKDWVRISMCCPICKGSGQLEGKECERCFGARLIGFMGTLEEAKEWLNGINT